jgi:hypothetical protein
MDTHQVGRGSVAGAMRAPGRVNDSQQGRGRAVLAALRTGSAPSRTEQEKMQEEGGRGRDDKLMAGVHGEEVLGGVRVAKLGE